MSLSSAKFRLEGDNTSAMRALNDFSSKVKNVGGEINHEIAERLKGAFAIGAIEEAIRRTGEWSVELQRSARELGITVEEMQALRLASERAHISTEKIFSYYSKLEAAALKAASGNQKLASSFKTLGVSSEQIRTGSPEELF